VLSRKREGVNSMPKRDSRKEKGRRRQKKRRTQGKPSVWEKREEHKISSKGSQGEGEGQHKERKKKGKGTGTPKNRCLGETERADQRVICRAEILELATEQASGTEKGKMMEETEQVNTKSNGTSAIRRVDNLPDV